MSVTYWAAAAAVAWVAYRTYQAKQTEEEVHTEGDRTPEYRNAAHMMSAGPTVVKKVYKEGPLSWIAEEECGKKWIAYSASDNVPATFQRLLVTKPASQ